MSNYRRLYYHGGCYFFTAVTYKRRHIFQTNQNIQILRESFQHIMEHRPFQIDAIVILPDHIHCIWTLPENDSDFSTRWRLIKRHFSARISAPVSHGGEKKIWQRRFWEHLINDENDLKNHINYIHYNPVKHGYVSRPEAWECSSYHRNIAQHKCSDLQGKTDLENIEKMNFE